LNSRLKLFFSLAHVKSEMKQGDHHMWNVLQLQLRRSSCLTYDCCRSKRLVLLLTSSGTRYRLIMSLQRLFQITERIDSEHARLTTLVSSGWRVRNCCGRR
jgi:hypothetical protein